MLGCLGSGQDDRCKQPGLSLNGSCYYKCKPFIYLFIFQSCYLDDTDYKKKKRKLSGPPEGGEPENHEAPTKGMTAITGTPALQGGEGPGTFRQVIPSRGHGRLKADSGRV